MTTSADTLDAKGLEVERLRGTMSDLVSVLALSSQWNAAEPAEIFRTLLEALRGMLRLELAYLMWNGAEACIGQLAAAGEIGHDLRRSLGKDQRAWPASARCVVAGAELSVASVQLGLGGELGVLVAASERPAFPSAHETLLLRVAANQAAVALQAALLLAEQRLRTVELDLQVAQRTRALTEANASLQRELAERGRAEGALRESASYTRSALDGIPGFVAVLSAAGGVEMVNQRILDYCGQSLEELRHWSENGTIHSDDLPHLMEVFVPSIAAGVPYLIEQRLRRHDGAYRWFDNRGAPVRDEAGQVVRWHVLLSDVDDRKRAEQALAASAQTFRQSFDAIPTLAWCNRTDGSNEFLNQRWHDYTGLTAQEANGWGWQVALHADDLPLLLVKWQHMLQSGEPGELEARLRRHDGVYRWFLFRCDPLRDANGSVVRWYGTNTDIDDVKKAERALADSERTLKLTIDTIPALAWSARADGAADFFNQHYLEYVGLSLSQLCDWQWTSLIHPHDAAAVADTWERCRESRAGAQLEARIRRADGVYRWFLFRASPLLDEAGEVVKWYGTKTDIDDRKRAEQALAASEHKLQLTIDTLPAMVWSANRTGEAEYFNKHFLDYVGLTLDDVRGWGWTKLIHPYDVSTLTAAWGRFRAAGTAGEVEARYRRHDGVYRWFLFRGQPLRNESGEVVSWYGINADIEDRKRAEQALADSERENRHIAHSIAGMVAVFSPQGELNGGNQQLLDYFQLPLEEIGQWATNGITHPDDLQHCIDVFMGSVRSGAPYDYETRFRRHDGEWRWFQLRGRPLRDSEGHIVRWYGLLTDIEDRKRAEAAIDKVRSDLAHVTRSLSLSALTASIAHEVNQPLSGIITNASTCVRMLTADPPNVAGALETARRTIRDGNRASDVISRLRSLYRRKEFVSERLDLNEAAAEVLALSSQELKRRGIVVQTDYAESLPPLMGDRVQLQQVIVNLVLNAADAMSGVQEGSRRLVVETVEDPLGTVRLTVADTGIGFANDELSRVFEPFYTTKQNGMGIGLYVSRSIIDRHLGELSARANDGPGAAFSFSIPCAPASD